MGRGLVQSVEEAPVAARLVAPRERELEAEALEAAELVVERIEGAMNVVEPIAQGRGKLARRIGEECERRALHDALLRRAAVAARRRGVAAPSKRAISV